MTPALAAGALAAALGVALVVVVRSGRRGLAVRLGPYRAGAPEAVAPTAGAVWSPDRHPTWRGISRRLGTDRLAARMRDAGLPDTEVDAFRLRQYGQAGAGAAVGVALGGVLVQSAAAAALMAVTGAALGMSRAPARLARMAEERRTRMRLELVTIDQVLAIHVRAGAGPVQAVMRVVARGHGAVIEELRSIVGSIRAGRSEVDAFRHAAATTAEPHAARTYRLFALAAEQGADLGVALRALSDDLRAVRRDELRRQATRRRAAMLIPTIAVLAPIMLLFVIAPLPSIVLGGR